MSIPPGLTSVAEPASRPFKGMDGEADELHEG